MRDELPYPNHPSFEGLQTSPIDPSERYTLPHPKIWLMPMRLENLNDETILNFNGLSRLLKLSKPPTRHMI
jgi:hypothetical protein